MPRNNTQPSAAQVAAREAGAARLREANEKRVKAAKRGKTAPVRSRRLDVDTTDLKVGQDKERRIFTEGRAGYERDDIDVIDRPVSGTQLELMKFAEEMVTVLVHDTTNPTDEHIPYVINGGVRQAFFRGKEQRVKRKFVEILARMKVQTYTQEKYRDSQDIDAIRQIPHSALRFPFTVIDDSPRGKEWLKKILAEE